MSIINKIKGMFQGPAPMTTTYSCTDCSEEFDIPEDEAVVCPHCGAEGGISTEPAV